MKKTKPQLIEDLKVEVSGDTAFMVNARLLQAIWRKEKYPEIKFKKGEYGNYLPLEFAKDTKANFLTNHIGDIVEENVKNSTGLIKEPRIWNNLLSSQPLAFNLFGELTTEKGLKTTTKLFKKLININIEKVTEINFEYSPGRRKIKYTNDRTAFDVFVKYDTSEGKKGFIGIEVKYSEHMYDKPDKIKLDNKVKTANRYKQIAKDSGLFQDESINKLMYSNIHQLWRDHLLALSMFISNNDYDIGHYVILYPKDNQQCTNTIKKYLNTFKESSDNSFFILLTLEKLIDTLKSLSNDKWIDQFVNRYLNFTKIQ